jgi:hypothetical protein
MDKKLLILSLIAPCIQGFILVKSLAKYYIIKKNINLIFKSLQKYNIKTNITPDSIYKDICNISANNPFSFTFKPYLPSLNIIVNYIYKNDTCSSSQKLYHFIILFLYYNNLAIINGLQCICNDFNFSNFFIEHIHFNKLFDSNYKNIIKLYYDIFVFNIDNSNIIINNIFRSIISLYLKWYYVQSKTASLNNTSASYYIQKRHAILNLNYEFFYFLFFNINYNHIEIAKFKTTYNFYTNKNNYIVIKLPKYTYSQIRHVWISLIGLINAKYIRSAF